MAPIPWQLSQLGVAAATYGLVRYHPELSFVTRSGYLGCFLMLSFALMFAKFIYSTIIWPHWITPLAKLPTPKGAGWFHGHFVKIFLAGTGEIERRWVHEVPNDGMIYYRSIFNSQRVIVTSPKTVQEVCTRTQEFVKASPARGIAGRILGEGLVLSELDKHKAQRRVFVPIFAPRHIREMCPIFWNKTREVTQKLTGLSLGAPAGTDAVFEVGHWASRTALDIVTMATLGKNFGSIEDENSALSSTFRQAIEPSRGYVVMALLKLWLPERLVDMAPNRWNKTMHVSVPVFRKLCRDLLRERRQEVAQDKSHSGKDLLSLVFRYEEIAGAGEEELIDQMITFLAAGHETISVGITWAIYMLCLHSEWQDILRQEARANLPDPNVVENGEKELPEFSSANIDKMPLTQAFVNEVLRWYPPIPQTMREPLQDTIIDGQLVPKGTWVIVPFKGIHRDPRFWGPDAAKFNPRRWLNPDGTVNTTGGCVNKYANLSFMQGIRSCIAQGFSKAEMACVIGAWIGRFSFELVDKELMDEDKMEITIGSLSGRPLHGLDVKWKVVDGW